MTAGKEHSTLVALSIAVGNFLIGSPALRAADNEVDFVKEQRLFIAPAFTGVPDADTKLTILANY